MYLQVHVHPRAHADAIREWKGDVLHVNLRATPKENEANIALLRFLADFFDIPKTSLALVRGHGSRHKTVSLPDSVRVRPSLETGS